MTRTNLVDAYDNRSVVAKLVNMEERISGAESSIEKTVEDGQTSIDTKVSTGVAQISTLMTDLKDIKTEATAAASTAETATATANAAATKAENASATIAANVTTCANAAADAKGYATSGVLHDGTAVNSAEYFQKLTQTAADQASDYADTAKAQATNAGNQAGAAAEARTAAQTFAANAKTSETNAAASATAAAASAASIDTTNLVNITDSQTITGAKVFTNLVASPKMYIANAGPSAAPKTYLKIMSVIGANPPSVGSTYTYSITALVSTPWVLAITSLDIEVTRTADSTVSLTVNTLGTPLITGTHDTAKVGVAVGAEISDSKLNVIIYAYSLYSYASQNAYVCGTIVAHRFESGSISFSQATTSSKPANFVTVNL